MNRGVLTLSREELEEIVKITGLEKFQIAFQNIQDSNEVFVNSEELEEIMDSIDPRTNNLILETVKNKMAELYRKMGD